MSTSESETIGLYSTTVDIDVMPTAAVGDILSDRYRLDEEIGGGGMVLVSGEPGSGNIRLARELIDYACITGGAVHDLAGF